MKFGIQGIKPQKEAFSEKWINIKLFAVKGIFSNSLWQILIVSLPSKKS